jgi:hypothetical protein
MGGAALIKIRVTSLHHYKPRLRLHRVWMLMSATSKHEQSGAADISPIDHTF